MDLWRTVSSFWMKSGNCFWTCSTAEIKKKTTQNNTKSQTQMLKVFNNAQNYWNIQLLINKHVINLVYFFCHLSIISVYFRIFSINSKFQHFNYDLGRPKTVYRKWNVCSATNSPAANKLSFIVFCARACND